MSDLRLCSMCRTWNARPCSNGCYLSVNDPTWEVITRAETPHQPFNARLETDGILTPEGDYPDRIWFTPEDNSSKGYIRLDLHEAALTRAETPQSIPSEREAVVAWLDSQIIEHDRHEPGSAFDSGRASAFHEAKQAIARGEHLSTRQAPIEGSAK